MPGEGGTYITSSDALQSIAGENAGVCTKIYLSNSKAIKYRLFNDDTVLLMKSKIKNEKLKSFDDHGINEYEKVKMAPPKRFLKRKDIKFDVQVVSMPSKRAVVSLQYPHTILSVSGPFLEWLGYSQQELVGRSLKILSGPSTDTSSLHTAIKCATRTQANIYAKDGRALAVLLSCSTLDGAPPTCSLEISQQDPLAPALLSPAPPLAIAAAAHRAYYYRTGLALHTQHAAAAAAPWAVGDGLLLDALLAAPCRALPC